MLGFCLKSNIIHALQIHQKQKFKLEEKNDKLFNETEKLLHECWHKIASKFLFLKELHLMKILILTCHFCAIGPVRNFIVDTAQQMGKLMQSFSTD